MKCLFHKIVFVGLILLADCKLMLAQEQIVHGINGNFEINSQFYKADSAIEAPEVSEKMLNNAFMNVNYINGNFRAGLRYEAYLNPILGFDERYKGSGIPFRYAAYTKDAIDITVGNFYDQFGNGLILRCYEERAIGLDNALDGIRVGYKPAAGIYIKGMIGRQRDFFELSSGLLRGIDGNIQLNEAIEKLKDKKLQLGFGGSFVSKYEKDEDLVRNLPENVASWAARTNMTYGKLSMNVEFAYKYNDPYIGNNYIYKNGEALYINTTYSQKGFGAELTAKRVDNMGYRSERTATVNQLIINYLPTINKQYTYRLLTLYPYATQSNGEMGISGSAFYKIKSDTKLGGKYGADIAINASAVNDIQKSPASNDTLGYESDFFAIGKTIFYRDLGLEVTKKISKKLKMILSYTFQKYNKDVIEGKSTFGLLDAHTGVVEITWKLTSKQSIRTELQHLYTKDDKQSWAMWLVEYSISPNWSFTIFDEYNYGNDIPDHRYHYYNATCGYTRNANRFSIGYVRQRAGLLCIGGVCRVVPASNGVSLSITSRF